MRSGLLSLVSLAVLLPGAASPAGCSLPPSLLADLALSRTTLRILVVNEAYQAVRYSLVTSAVTQAAATAPASQPSVGGGTLDKNARFDTTLPCAGLPPMLACQVTFASAGGADRSATSRTLYFGRDYECGSVVTFTIREAVRVGLVVGVEVD